MWNAGTIPFVILAIAVSSGPVWYMTYHSHRHGHVASLPDHARVPKVADPQQFGWTICTHCKAVVVELEDHRRAVHENAPTHLAPSQG
jgi:hypothetical protein